jgi:hypothetical protein
MKSKSVTIFIAIIFAFRFAIAYGSDSLDVKGNFISTANGYIVSATKINGKNEYKFYVLDINLNKVIIEQDINIKSLPDYCIATLDYIFMFDFDGRYKRLFIYDLKKKSFTSKFSKAIHGKIVPSIKNSPTDILFMIGVPENNDSTSVYISSINKKTLDVRSEKHIFLDSLDRPKGLLPLSVNSFMVFTKDTVFYCNKNLVTHKFESTLGLKYKLATELFDDRLVLLCKKEIIICSGNAFSDCQILPFEANEGSEYYLSGAYIVEKRNNTFVSHKLIK